MIFAIISSALAFAVAAAPTSAVAQAAAPESAAAANSEAPELGRPGPHPIGTRSEELTLPPRHRITAKGVMQAERSVGLRFWYPAAESGHKAAATIYRHVMQLPGQPEWTWQDSGQALEGAAIGSERKAPLVLLSHGFGGWSTHMSRLAEGLASRGYVVASIDHRDVRFDSVPGFLLSFGNVLGDRAEDQRQVLERLVSGSWPKGHPMALIDPSNVGLIGYSMGGYGALATAGASPDPASKALSQLPGEVRALASRADDAAAQRVKALVLIAPWGGQASDRVWAPEALARVAAPTLLIGGNQDRIVGFDQGIRWIFDGLKGVDRRLLVYREAQHNVAGNAVALDPTAPAQAIEFLRDPVWRGDRINYINQHFITAFLDLTLRGQAARAEYLDVPAVLAADGEWPLPFGEQTRGAVAGASQPKYWRGFQRGTATGLELHHKRAGQ
jgi:predicted dienelactone hydrolase